MTPAGTSSAVFAVNARLSVFTRAIRLPQLYFVTCVVENALRFFRARVHLEEHFILFLHVAAVANVEIFVQ